MDSFDIEQPIFLEEPDAEKFKCALGREPGIKIGDTIAYTRGSTERIILEVLAFGYRSFRGMNSSPALLLGNIKTGATYSMVYDEGTEEKYEKVALPASE